MNNYRLGGLDDWQSLDLGSSLSYAVPDGPAAVGFQLLASEEVNIFADQGDGPQLVGVGAGNIRVRFTARNDFELSAVACGESSSPEVWIKGRREPQIVAESRIPSFATIEPRGIGPSDNVRRMMQMMQINNRRREDMLRLELERLGDAYSAIRDAQLARSAPQGQGDSPSPAAPAAAPSEPSS